MENEIAINAVVQRVKEEDTLNHLRPGEKFIDRLLMMLKEEKQKGVKNGKRLEEERREERS